MNKARLKVTLKCNKKCVYCINKHKDYRDKWTTITNVNEVNWSKYRSIVISGGDPTLYDDLSYAISCIRGFTNVPIYLQTNGLLLTKQMVKNLDNMIDGIGISVHDINEFNILYTRFKDILKIKPIKLYIQDTMVGDQRLLDKWNADGFQVRQWTDGDFDETEEIFVLNDKI